MAKTRGCTKLRLLDNCRKWTNSGTSVHGVFSEMLFTKPVKILENGFQNRRTKPASRRAIRADRRHDECEVTLIIDHSENSVMANCFPPAAFYPES